MIVMKRPSFLSTTCKLIKRSTTTRSPESTLISKFTQDEQEKILTTLNSSNAEQLSRFNVTQARIKSLEKWKSKEGPFQTLSDVLEVDGLGIKVLERLCESIVTEVPVSKTPKPRRQYLTPALNSEHEKLQSAVGLHLGSNGISWAKLCAEGNRVENWSYVDFSTNEKKMLPLDTFKLAMRILNEIPTGSVYIFEASVPPQGNKPSYNQQLELTSMLFALINTSTKHSKNGGSIYHLKANLSARLFKTLVGSERVSSITPVSSILQNSTESFPCSIVNIDESLQQQYGLQSPVIRELLGQALLLTVTFMELCVYKNPGSVTAVMPSRR